MKNIFFWAIFIALIAMLCAGLGYAQEGGYLSSLSVAKGEKLDFYLSTSFSSFDVPIYRLGKEKTLVWTIKSISGGIQTTGDSAFILGCNWFQSVEIWIPIDWRSGVYEAELPTSEGIKPLIFVVREKVPGSYSKTVVNLTVNTWEAYNNWGGKSLYNYNSTKRTASVKVSFNRPFSDATSALYFQWTDKLVKWLENENTPVEYCVSTDLDRDPHFMDHYNLYTTVGHDEYWSMPERWACENFLARSGRMIVLSGNTCWWQVRLEDSLRTLVCYRTYDSDPFYKKADSLVTVVWSRVPLFNPENKFLGTSFQNGGYVNHDTLYSAAKGYGGYTVFNSNHWIYDSLDVHDGDIIGLNDTIVGYEVDGVLYKWKDGVPVATTYDLTPYNYKIFGLSPSANSDNLRNGDATMGYYTTPSGGAVFNSASINWVSGLAGKDSVIPQMLRNVIGKFSRSKSLPPEIDLAEPVNVWSDTINHEKVFLSYRIFPNQNDVPDTFKVQASDPMGKDLKYLWKIEERKVGTTPTCILPTYLLIHYPKGFVITAYITNGIDTVTQEWNIVDSNVAIVSAAPADTLPQHSGFRYKARAISKRGANITYTLPQAPSWLHIDKKGFIFGSLDTLPGKYNIVLKAQDKKGYFDKQIFTIHISDTTTKVDTTIRKDTTIGKDTTHHTNAVSQNVIAESQLSCFPNPFSDRSNLSLTLSEEAKVEIEIYDVTGAKIRNILSATEFASGNYTFLWDRMTDDRRKVSEGIYFVRVTLIATSGKNSTIVKKIVVM